MTKRQSSLRETSRQPGRFRRMFMDRVAELGTFHNENGRYPEPAEGSLGHWVYLVRKDWALYPVQTRSPWKIKALESLPEWSWDGYIQSRRYYFIQKVADWYLSVDGIADPAHSITEQRELAQWVSRNREVYFSNGMEPSRILELESIPFWSWDIKNNIRDHKRSLIEQELSWMLDNSLDCRARSGGVTGFSGVRHQCDLVIEQHKIIVELDGRLWHADMRDIDNAKTIDLEKSGWTVIRIREEPLEAIAGITVSVSTSPSMAEILRSTRETLQELGVQSHDIDFEALGRVAGTRTPHYDDWYSSLEAFQTYIAGGGSSVPIATQMTGEFKVGQWVYVQRGSLKRGSLPKQKKEMLESIPGWKWELKPQVRFGWDATYERLLEYQREHGSIPPAKFAYSDGLKLGSWAAYQRYSYRRAELSADRLTLLESVEGWYW